MLTFYIIAWIAVVTGGALFFCVRARIQVSKYASQLRQVQAQAQANDEALRGRVAYYVNLFDSIKGSGRLTLNEFQAACTPHRWNAPNEQTDIAAICLGMMTASGQLAEQLRANFRGEAPWNPQEAAHVLGELAREVASCASLCGYKLEEIGKMQLEKMRGTDEPAPTNINKRKD